MRSSTPLLFAASALLAGCGGGGGGSSSSGSGRERFEVSIRNISSSNTLSTSQGKAPVAFSSFILAVHRANSANPFFTLGSLGKVLGLEAFAEAGDPSTLLSSLQENGSVSLINLSSTPVGASGPALLGPGSEYKAVVEAAPGDAIAIASSFLDANDLLLATPDAGISPFLSDGTPVTGDFPNAFELIDVGTEKNEEPGAGTNQVLTQSSDSAGVSENEPVSLVNDGFRYPQPNSMIQLQIKPLQTP